jgi:hypothetical protein
MGDGGPFEDALVDDSVARLEDPWAFRRCGNSAQAELKSKRQIANFGVVTVKLPF